MPRLAVPCRLALRRVAIIGSAAVVLFASYSAGLLWPSAAAFAQQPPRSAGDDKAVGRAPKACGDITNRDELIAMGCIGGPPAPLYFTQTDTPQWTPPPPEDDSYGGCFDAYSCFAAYGYYGTGRYLAPRGFVPPPYASAPVMRGPYPPPITPLTPGPSYGMPYGAYFGGPRRF